jgi:hypothetical protein
MIGVFCFDSTWRAWSPQGRARQLQALRELGVTAIVTETIEPPVELVRDATAADLQTYVSIACFSAHAWPHLVEGMDLRPVQADGRPRPTLEWYTGLIPTHDAYNQAHLGRIARIAEARPTGIILDFIRWPMHWELELRAGAPEPDESSFDERSLDAFATWLEARGDSKAGALDAAALTGPLRDRWTTFKCDVITRFACAAAAVIRSVDPIIEVGAFIVPGTEDQRRRLLGQDVRALGDCLDLLLPMTYHSILHEPVDLVERVTSDIAGRTSAPVVPVVQVTAEESVAHPWDWGEPVSVEEMGHAVEIALLAASGVVLFPFEGLDPPRREMLTQILGARSDEFEHRRR